MITSKQEECHNGDQRNLAQGRDSLQPLPSDGAPGKSQQKAGTDTPYNIKPAPGDVKDNPRTPGIIGQDGYTQASWILSFIKPDDAVFRIGRIPSSMKATPYLPGWRDVCSSIDYTGYENIYFTPQPRCPGLNTQGGKDDIVALSCLALDIEYGKKGHSDKQHPYAECTPEQCIDKVKARITDMGISQPTYIVQSGHGYHIYWLYEQAYKANNDNRITQIILQDYLTQCLSADANYKYSMLLRVPGSYNLKLSDDKKSLLPRAQVSLIEVNTQYHNRDDMMQAVSGYAKSRGIAISSSAINEIEQVCPATAEQMAGGDNQKKHIGKIAVQVESDTGDTVTVQVARRRGKNLVLLAHARKNPELIINNIIKKYVPGIKRQGSWYRGVCPFCGNTKSNPAFSVGIKHDTMIFYCHRCTTPPRGGDMIDFLRKTGDANNDRAARKIIAKALGQAIEKTDADYLLEAMQDAGITVLGYTLDGGLKFYIQMSNGQVQALKESEIKGVLLSSILGDDDRVPGSSAAARALAHVAHDMGRFEQALKMADGSLQYINDTWIAVDKSGFYDVAGGFTRLNNVVMDCYYPGGKKWIDTTTLKNNDYLRGDPRASLGLLHQTIKGILSQWHWDGGVDTLDLLTAYVMVAGLQREMMWRPFIHITGPKGSGKTQFVKHFLGKLWAGVATMIDKPSMFAVIKKASSGKVIILDEFELTRHIKNIINVFKVANDELAKDGGVVRGRADQTTVEYAIPIMPWIACISDPIQDGDSAGKSRVVQFELSMPQPGDTLSMPGDKQLKVIQHACIQTMAELWPEIDAKARAYTYKHHRALDNLRYAIAINELINPEYQWQNVVDKLHNDNEAAQLPDETHLLNLILDSIVRYEQPASYNKIIPKNITVRALMCQAVEAGRHNDGIKNKMSELLKQGIMCQILKQRGVWCLALVPGWAERQLKDLRHTMWHDVKFTPMLKRLPGAKHEQVWCADKHNRRCVVIPIDGAIDVMGDIYNTITETIGIPNNPGTQSNDNNISEYPGEHIIDALPF